MADALRGPLHGRRVALLGALAACALCGCLSAPKPASSIVPGPAISGSSALSQSQQNVLPVGYWKRTGSGDAQTLLAPGRRVVITEFGVELIDLQSQGPFKRQMAINPPPLITGPITPVEFVAFGAGVCANVAGLGRKNSRLAEEHQQQLAQSLLETFEQEMSRRGLIVAPIERARSSPSYADLHAQPKLKSSFAMLFNPIGSDTGTVLRTHTVGAPGVGVVTKKNSARLAAEQLVLRDSGADVAMAVRLRVGIFRKKAALEEGSVIRLITSDGETVFKAKHSILSDNDAIESSKFKLFIGDVQPLATDEFRRELATMLPKFVELALREPLSGSRPGDAQGALVRLPPVAPAGSPPSAPAAAPPYAPGAPAYAPGGAAAYAPGGSASNSPAGSSPYATAGPASAGPPSAYSAGPPSAYSAGSPLGLSGGPPVDSSVSPASYSANSPGAAWTAGAASAPPWSAGAAQAPTTIPSTTAPPATMAPITAATPMPPGAAARR